MRLFFFAMILAIPLWATEPRELLQALSAREQGYLRGLIAAHLYEAGLGERFGEIAEKSLLAEKSPEAMKTLGILYLMQKRPTEAARVFDSLVEEFPLAPEAAEVLLWGDEKRLQYLCETYPDSEYAAEAFFRLYYAKNDKTYLERMVAKYPRSSYCDMAYFLLGKQEADLSEALKYFERSRDDRACLEKARILLEQERIHEAEGVLLDLMDRSDEAAYLLVRIYMKEQNFDTAEQIIAKMFQKYDDARIVNGYFISRFWYERGTIALKENHPREALEYFLRSEQTFRNQDDELLDLWIQQSQCHRLLGQLDTSMQILSRVANYNAASSLRLKAMYLRAEIYQLQGRHDLAKKQLQATSTKGGDWALKAKQKMENDYGL